MRLEDIMSVPVRTIAPDASVAEARALFDRDRIHHLVVVHGSTPVGVLSSHDLIRWPDAAVVDDAMTTGIVTAGPRTSVREAANLLRGRAVGCLPVVEKGRVIGIVTISDLLGLIGRGVEKGRVQSTRRDLLGRGRGPRHSVRSERSRS